MRAILQRVSEARVTIADEITGEIGAGLLILLGVEEGDTREDSRWLAGKIARMRIFEDDEGKMNRSLTESGGSTLVVSQFTLHASTRKGNRPSCIRAARPEVSEPLYLEFCQDLGDLIGHAPARGRFGAMMQVALVNDGPVTIIIDSKLKEELARKFHEIFARRADTP